MGELDRTEGILPHNDLAEFSSYGRPNFRRGEALKCLVVNVADANHGPEIILSRASNNLVARLFELEVPEVEDGLVEVKSIARDAGDRSKVQSILTNRGLILLGLVLGLEGHVFEL